MHGLRERHSSAFGPGCRVCLLIQGLTAWLEPPLEVGRPDRRERRTDRLVERGRSSGQGYATCCLTVGDRQIGERLQEIGNRPQVALGAAEREALRPMLAR